MYHQILQLIRKAATERRVYLTIHANKELKNDYLTYQDVIHCLLGGEIIEQQIDSTTSEEKYLLYGDALNGVEMAVVTKLGYDQSSIIITVYRLRISDYDI